MVKILGVVDDLVFSMKLESILKNNGHKIDYYKSDIEMNDYDLILVDLSHKDAFKVIKSIPEKCIAFGSHVDVDSFKKARSLGCKRVLPRSRFFEELPNLI